MEQRARKVTQVVEELAILDPSDHRAVMESLVCLDPRERPGRLANPEVTDTCQTRS
jgi:hypothetical protein